MGQSEDAQAWVRSHGYNVFVTDFCEIDKMLQSGCSNEELHTRVREMQVICILETALDDFEDNVCDLIHSAFVDVERLDGSDD